MVLSPSNSPFEAPEFLEGLEAAGYLQRLDVSEARITARFQHALVKMHFASHSEEFVSQARVKEVHGSTVQFFNEEPVTSDPFVHVLVGSLPPSRSVAVTPRGLATTQWTPINSPDEAAGTIHFTVSHPGYWPITVVFDTNTKELATEDKYAPADSGSEADSGMDEDENNYYSLGGRNSNSNSQSHFNARRAGSNSGGDSRSASGRSNRDRFEEGAGMAALNLNDAGNDNERLSSSRSEGGGHRRRAGAYSRSNGANEGYEDNFEMGKSSSRSSAGAGSSSHSQRQSSSGGNRDRSNSNYSSSSGEEEAAYSMGKRSGGHMRNSAGRNAGAGAQGDGASASGSGASSRGQDESRSGSGRGGSGRSGSARSAY